MHGRISLLLGLTIAFWMPSAFGDTNEGARDDRFCAELSSVMKSAPARFENIKSEALDTGSWRSKVEFTGMAKCSIEKLESTIDYFTCVAFESPDKAAVEAAAQKLKHRVQSCLGETWEPRTRTRADGPSIQISREDDPTYISVRVRQNLRGAYVLKIIVDID